MKIVKTIFLAWLGAVCVTPARAAQTNGQSGPPSPPLSETYRDASGRMQQRVPFPPVGLLHANLLGDDARRKS